MKQIIAILVILTVLIVGCSKETPIPEKNLTIDEAHGCNVSDGYYWCKSNNSCYQPTYGPCAGQPIPPGALDKVPHFDYRGPK